MRVLKSKVETLGEQLTGVNQGLTKARAEAEGMQGTLEKLNNAVKKEKDEADALEKKIEEKKEAFKKVSTYICTATASKAASNSSH